MIISLISMKKLLILRTLKSKKRGAVSSYILEVCIFKYFMVSWEKMLDTCHTSPEFCPQEAKEKAVETTLLQCRAETNQLGCDVDKENTQKAQELVDIWQIKIKPSSARSAIYKILLKAIKKKGFERLKSRDPSRRIKKNIEECLKIFTVTKKEEQIADYHNKYQSDEEAIIQNKKTIIQNKEVDKQKSFLIHKTLSHLGPKKLSQIMVLKTMIQTEGTIKLNGKSLDVSLIKDKLLPIFNSVLATLSNLQTHFSGNPKAQQAFANASINLGGSNNSEIYGGVFSAIDGIASSDDEKRKLKAEVAEVLGIDLIKGRPSNASMLKSQLYNRKEAADDWKKRVENNEVGADEEPVLFDKEHPIVMSTSPSVIIYPRKDGLFQCESKINHIPEPIHFQFPGDMPSEELNNLVNQQMVRAVFANKGCLGVVNDLLGLGKNYTNTTNKETRQKTFGNDGAMDSIIRTFVGANTTLGGRFLTLNEVDRVDKGIHWLYPNGDFGFFNAVDPAIQIYLVRALGFGSDLKGKDVMDQARESIQGNQLGTPSYKGLYRGMYPKDKNFARIKDPQIRNLLELPELNETEENTSEQYA